MRKIIVDNEVVVGHLDSCATHCFVSTRKSAQLANRGNVPFPITPFPVGQGGPLPDASKAHLCSLWMVSSTEDLVGFQKVLFLVVNTGADILIANNILDYLGILRYDPPTGYEQLLQRTVQDMTLSRHLPPDKEIIHAMIRKGLCMLTEISPNTQIPKTQTGVGQATETQDSPGTFASKSKEPGMNCNDGITSSMKDQIALTRKQERDRKINEAANLVVGPDPPLKTEITEALKLLKDIAENPSEHQGSASELESLQQKLSKGRPEWADCLTAEHTSTVAEGAQEAKTRIEEMMDGRFAKTVFAKTLQQPCSFAPFEIKTKEGSLPERSEQPRRFKDPKIVQLIEDWTDGLLQAGMVRKSSTPVAAPVTVVIKKGREHRVCVDFRERNSRTDCPIFPMPDVHDFLDDAAGFPLYCSFDCAKMFNQFEIVEEHRHLAAFITQQGTFEPCRVLFGLTGGPQHAVRSVRPAMREHPNTNGLAFTKWAVEQNSLGKSPPYPIDPRTRIVPGSRLDIFIDDCRIPAYDPEAMVKLCELWFLFCEEHRLILSRKKAKICLLYLTLLGFVVSNKGKHLDPNRVSSLLDIPQPTSKEGLHALLCSYNFVRMFIPNFSVLAAPLYAATRGIVWKGPGSGRSKGTRDFDPNFIWNDNLDRCLRQLQTAILSAPILLVPDYQKALFLSVDACLKGEGWVLWQILVGQNGSPVPVAIHYGSTKYDDAESTWEVTRQEAHAIQSALKDCYDYLFHCHFYLLTDHRNLTFLSDSVNRAVIRIRHFMQQFNMTVVHVPGIWNNPADGISRLEVKALPVKATQNLESATTIQIADEPMRTNRGTDPISQVETDDIVRSVSTSARALITSGQISESCPNQVECLLCNLSLTNYEEEFAQAFHTLAITESETPTVQINDPEELDWDIVEHVLDSTTEAGTALRTRSDWRRTSMEWNDKVRLKKASDDWQIVDPESEWHLQPTPELQVKEVSEQGYKNQSVPQPAPSVPVRSITEVCGSTIDTQTTPADFRQLRIDIPHFKDFEAIHNNEEGHHGLAHSYRKLLVRCGSLWAEERTTATKIKAELRAFIENCPICQKIRGLQERVKCKHSFIVSRPFLEASYDFIVFEKTDRRGNRYMIVVVDNFTKLTEFRAQPTRGVEDVACFLMEIKARYGPIHRLRSDREKAFTSQVVTRLNTLAGTEMTLCVVYHPQANSVCERQNQIIMIHLRNLCLGAKLGPDSIYSWSDLIPFVYSIVNNTPKLPLAISPLSLVYGVFSNYDRPLLDARLSGPDTSPVDYVEGLMAWQSRLLDLAEDIQSKHYEKLIVSGKDHRSFQEGDFVLQAKKSQGLRGKLVSRWIGPRLVLTRRDNDPSHPILDLLDLVTTKVIEASIEDCRLLKTGWFEEATMLPDLKRLAAIDKEEYEVEAILEHRPPGPIRPSKSKPNDYWFKVKWSGFSDEENSWEPYSELKELLPLEEYLAKFPLLKLQ